MHKFRLKSNSACDCGETQQTIKHIIVDCLTLRFQENMKEMTELAKEDVDRELT